MQVHAPSRLLAWPGARSGWSIRDRLVEPTSLLQSMAAVVGAAFVFNVAVTGWTAVVAGRWVQDGAALAALGGLYSACELVRVPALVLLPALTLRYGARSLTLAGLVGLACLPLVLVGDLGRLQMAITLLLSAVPSTAVYAGLPAFAIGAAGVGRDGRALALLSLVSGAGGGIGPWLGGWLADTWGPRPVLLLACASCGLLIPVLRRGLLPPPTPWQGWTSLARRVLPLSALLVLVFASAGDATRATLAPAELIQRGLSLGDAGFLLGTGSALMGAGFLAFGYAADHQSRARVICLGLAILAIGSSLAALTAGPSVVFAIAAATVGLGANGARLGAELVLIGWIGRDRAAVAMALAAMAVLGGRVVGQPSMGAIADAYGNAAALAVLGAAGFVGCGLSLFPRMRRSGRDGAVPGH